MLQFIKRLFVNNKIGDFEKFFDGISKDISAAFKEENPSYVSKINEVERVIYITAPIKNLTYIAVVYITTNKGVLIESDIVNKSHSLLYDKKLPKFRESYDGIALTAIHEYIYNNQKGNK